MTNKKCQKAYNIDNTGIHPMDTDTRHALRVYLSPCKMWFLTRCKRSACAVSFFYADISMRNQKNAF